MKIKHMQLTITRREDVMSTFRKNLSSLRKGESPVLHHAISFETIDALRRLLTQKRLEILHVVKEQEPQSIYELAKIVQRDLKNVTTDIQILVDLGLIILEEHHDERKKIKPLVSFDKINVEITV
jgi:predicted transcriptional regulator